MTVFIYALSETDNISGIKYVGASNNPNSRFEDHLKSKENSKKDKWIESLLINNKKPHLIILEETTDEFARQKENFWIEKLSYLNLLNTFPSGYFTKKTNLQDKSISIRLNSELLFKIKKIAEQRGVNYQSMIKNWIGEKLNEIKIN